MNRLPRRRRRPKMGTRKSERIRCPAHLAWVRGCECIAARNYSHECSGPIQAAHVRKGTDGGTSIKPSDCYVVPLCAFHHEQQHRHSERVFEDAHGVDLLVQASLHWLFSPPGKRYRAKAEREAHELLGAG